MDEIAYYKGFVNTSCGVMNLRAIAGGVHGTAGVAGLVGTQGPDAILGPIVDLVVIDYRIGELVLVSLHSPGPRLVLIRATANSLQTQPRDADVIALDVEHDGLGGNRILVHQGPQERAAPASA